MNIVHFLRLMGCARKNVPLERCIQLMDGGFTNLNLAWMSEIAEIGYTWIFVYQRAHNYEDEMLVPPSYLKWL